ncbi:MAG: hybrid sensor histidine kinase/response regulator, partial [Gemmatimonadetes bacterium]|nr:hybrid sensor histidine kinase/response regulator [Gemmatimonadota bacterium]NIS01278.1 hybrid sensor histidine kinase/response regulator [Gemmatimonadota bacterium]NIT67404.1 hybrid sensor histidine kinase/response regulator [Gemmatimonadota bacterium]NIV24123.1 hybrid sensor histidine kinase/response regulator [Gemmatimonadota bacterium]NIW75477.1 hybrid sensor histidine kinase/response regulator [Gemmatimonadota bacterium]
LQPELIDLNRVVSSMEKTLRRLLPAEIDLELELAKQLDRVRADPGQVEQVIINL